MMAPTEAAQDDRKVQAKTWHRWGLFVLIGLCLYAALYVWSERLVYVHGASNRYFMIRTAPPAHYDFVVLGASHAMPLGFGDMNAHLEQTTGGKIMNLSTEGAGILPNRLLLEYFLTRHTADRVVYILDSFAFYSPLWNEERLDAAMLRRAPLDPALAAILLRYPWARDELPAYLSGFSKINNADRFAPDVPQAETERFDRVYRPNAQIDRQRIRFLYPDGANPEAFARYLDAFRSLIAFIEAQGMEMVVIEPPTPPRYRDQLPDEPSFHSAVREVTEPLGVAWYDLSEAIVEDDYFYDTDHLNREGARTLIDGPLGAILRERLGGR